MTEMWAYCPTCVKPFWVPPMDRRREIACSVCLTPPSRSAMATSAEAAMSQLAR